MEARQSMRAVLFADLTVEHVAVFAEMAWMERRPEVGLVCRAACNDGNRLSVTAVQSVLPGLADVGAKNVIEWCRMLGLCDAHGGMTALGLNVADSDEAPVPEQGVYGFWLAQHPLVGRRVLAAERVSSSVDRRFDVIQALPVEPDRGVVFRSVVGAQQRYVLRDLPSNNGQVGCIRGTTKATCRLRWTLDFDASRDEWQLEGAIEAPQGGMTAMQHQPESAGIDLWSLAKTWGTGPLASIGRWQPEERRLAVGIQELTDGEQEAFKKSFKLPRVDVPGKGSFADVALEDVPIGPTTIDEAQRWALSRLGRALARRPMYRSRVAVRQLFAELTEATPLERFHPTLPDHDALLVDQLRAQRVDLFWSLAAAVDLAPDPVPHADLAAFRIGKPAGQTSVAVISTPDEAEPTRSPLPNRAGR